MGVTFISSWQMMDEDEFTDEGNPPYCRGECAGNESKETVRVGETCDEEDGWTEMGKKLDLSGEVPTIRGSYRRSTPLGAQIGRCLPSR